METRNTVRLGVGVLLGYILLSSNAASYVRIIINGTKLKWSSSTIEWRMNSQGSDDIADNSEMLAIVRAFENWEQVPGSKVKFNRKGNTNSKNHGANTHIVFFDENNSSGFFPGLSTTVAITPISYDVPTGIIQDSDIVFNGKDFNWTTTGEPGRFDVQDVATHEIGHFMGLDHSPVLGSSLWPYVVPNQWHHRSLSADDEAGAVDISSAGNTSTLEGRVKKSNGTVLKGGLVCAVSVTDGSLKGVALSDSDGDWRIRGLDSGAYHVYVKPVEGGISAANLAGNEPVQIVFGARFYGPNSNPTSFTLGPTTTRDIGQLILNPDSDLSDQTNKAEHFVPGQGRLIHLAMTGFTGTNVFTLNPFISVNVTNVNALTVSVNVTVQIGCPLGEYDLYFIRNDGDFEAAVGVLEVVAPAPVLMQIQPSLGSTIGGSTVTLTGADFQSGAYVLFGGKEAPVVNVIDSGTIEVEIPAHDVGAVGVQVQNPDGRFDHNENAFTYADTPTFDSMFPVAGHTGGNTTVMLNGDNFAENVEIYFGGVAAAHVDRQSANLLHITTPNHAAGPVDLLIRNPPGDDLLLTNGFEFVPQADPQILRVSPGRSSRDGGTPVLITGVHLGSTTGVRFGVDPVCAQGGKEASQITISTVNEIQTLTPAHPAGNYGIFLTTATGQGVMAPSTFQFLPAQKSTASAGGGGCGGTITGQRAVGPGDAPAFAFMALILWFGRRRRS